MIPFLASMAVAQPLYGDSCTIDKRWRSLPTPDLRTHLRKELAEQGRALYERRSEDVRMWPKPETERRFKHLSRQALHHVLCATWQNELAEVDQVMAAGDTWIPVTIWVDADRVTVAEGPALAPMPRATVDVLSKRYGLALSTEVAWGERTLGALDVALGLLSENERHQVAEVRYIRTNEPPAREDGLAFYDGREHAILVFDTSMQSTRFVGSVEAPHHPMVATFLHELAHAIDSRRRLRAEDMEAYKARQTEGKRLQRPSDRFRDAFDGLAVSVYARSSSTEAFAEAFSLYKADPAALRRISPEAWAWFDAEEHLKAVWGPPAVSSPPP